MSSGVTWTGATAGVLAITGIATGWYWLIGVAALAAVIGVILIRMSRRRSVVRGDESAAFEAMVQEDASGTEGEAPSGPTPPSGPMPTR
ncbi:hypothetical protein ACFOE1_09040 [Agromyces mediolanus]|uniref:Uncharacterized protein n=1 Tax=Agromyces mediolanus TaxID=41986 RepID=A0A918CDQ5_AGRME|nr:hypothetical protein [Agromyces mediolanus]GGR18922.1 hypothetical protein GCM10010196_10100 [Agromyces mediolanus]GLJ71375.1 hypothetical protein GCM10017583_06310 [Agromyces mediolanus]